MRLGWALARLCREASWFKCFIKTLKPLVFGAYKPARENFI
jgi:hypothetical protein